MVSKEEQVCTERSELEDDGGEGSIELPVPRDESDDSQLLLISSCGGYPTPQAIITVFVCIEGIETEQH